MEACLSFFFSSSVRSSLPFFHLLLVALSLAAMADGTHNYRGKGGGHRAAAAAAAEGGHGGAREGRKKEAVSRKIRDGARSLVVAIEKL